MLKLKLQYFGHVMWRTDSLEKTLMLGNIEGRRRGDDRGWEGWMASLTWWTCVWPSPSVGDGQGSLACCSPWSHKDLDMPEHLSWTKLNWYGALFFSKKIWLRLFLLWDICGGVGNCNTLCAYFHLFPICNSLFKNNSLYYQYVVKDINSPI